SREGRRFRPVAGSHSETSAGLAPARPQAERTATRVLPPSEKVRRQSLFTTEFSPFGSLSRLSSLPVATSPKLIGGFTPALFTPAEARVLPSGEKAIEVTRLPAGTWSRRTRFPVARSHRETAKSPNPGKRDISAGAVLASVLPSGETA